jgi:cation:H+ antiporter
MLNLLLFAAGLVALVVGADLLVRGASKLALALGISPLVVGLTIVAFGTSAPEMAVSTGAVLSGSTELAIGNAVGSNVFNVLFILGVAALVTPLAVHIQVIRQEAPIMIGGALLLLVLSLDGVLSLFDSALLFGLLLVYTVFLIRQSRAETKAARDEYSSELTPAEPGGWDSRPWVQGLLIVVGLALLVGGAQALVSAAVVFARLLGVSDVVIGLTVVAIGTSLPEVAASVTAALKGERDIAVGNVVGSCVFNVFGVVGLAGLAAAFSGAGRSLFGADAAADHRHRHDGASSTPAATWPGDGLSAPSATAAVRAAAAVHGGDDRLRDRRQPDRAVPVLGGDQPDCRSCWSASSTRTGERASRRSRRCWSPAAAGWRCWPASSCWARSPAPRR